jgi:hypothetical protein
LRSVIVSRSVEPVTNASTAAALDPRPADAPTIRRGAACRLIGKRLLNEPLDLLDGIEVIERGKAMEPDAVVQYEFAGAIETQPAGFVTTVDGLICASAHRWRCGSGRENRSPRLRPFAGLRRQHQGSDGMP